MVHRSHVLGVSRALREVPAPLPASGIYHFAATIDAGRRGVRIGSTDSLHKLSVVTPTGLSGWDLTHIRSSLLAVSLPHRRGEV